MSETMPTRGPWTAYRLDAKGHEAFATYVEQTIKAGSPDDYFIVQGQKADGPADICHTGNGPTSAANAVLIASAPVMLEMLLEAAGVHREECRDYERCDYYQRLRAVIARARGES